jgi:hypothetical protein
MALSNEANTTRQERDAALVTVEQARGQIAALLGFIKEHRDL